MRRKTFIFVMIAVCFFANGVLHVSAASEVTGVTQTRSDEESVTVSWKRLKNAYGYDLFISSGNGKYKRLTNKTCDVVGSKNTKKKISNLTSSRTYYVVVKAVYKKENGKYGYVDKKGNVIVDYIYDDGTEQNSYGFVSVKKDGLWGSIDKNGKTVIEPKYNLENNLKIDFIGKWYLGEEIGVNYYCDK